MNTEQIDHRSLGWNYLAALSYHKDVITKLSCINSDAGRATIYDKDLKEIKTCIFVGIGCDT